MKKITDNKIILISIIVLIISFLCGCCCVLNTVISEVANQNLIIENQKNYAIPKTIIEEITPEANELPNPLNYKFIYTQDILDIVFTNVTVVAQYEGFRASTLCNRMSTAFICDFYQMTFTDEDPNKINTIADFFIAKERNKELLSINFLIFKTKAVNKEKLKEFQIRCDKEDNLFIAHNGEYGFLIRRVSDIFSGIHTDKYDQVLKEFGEKHAKKLNFPNIYKCN